MRAYSVEEIKRMGAEVENRLYSEKDMGILKQRREHLEKMRASGYGSVPRHKIEIMNTELNCLTEMTEVPKGTLIN